MKKRDNEEQFIKMEAPIINVGILTDKAIAFVFNQEYVHTESGAFLTGEQRALLVNDKIVFNGKLYRELFFEPAAPGATFDLKAVTIGKQFHWQRQEDQRFEGALELIVTPDGITAINQIGAEAYLESVISSEMSATSSLELLKAHAVISRSWLLAQVERKWERQGEASHERRTDTEWIRWYDREAHRLFDVCADDHCQRYQGTTHAFTPRAVQAVRETRGELLTDEGAICDARFSKCCGGVTERYESCWDATPHRYLTPVRDSRETALPDLTQEAAATRWIRSAPDAFCHTADPQILEQVLTRCDQETTDFFRWQVEYTQAELASLIRRKSGLDFGEIVDLVPVERGASGRLVRLQIVGTRRTLTVGKELEIRRWLSETHLYSSAFVVEKSYAFGALPTRFLLRGAGWGHGVGLCQIGAAVMGAQGYSYREILAHYYPHAVLERRY